MHRWWSGRRTSCHSRCVQGLFHARRQKLISPAKLCMFRGHTSGAKIRGAEHCATCRSRARALQTIGQERKLNRPYGQARHSADQQPIQSSETGKYCTRLVQLLADVLMPVRISAQTVLHGGITKTKAKEAKPTINGSRSVSTKAASATTTKAPAITRVRPRAVTPNAQSKQQAAGSSIKSNNAQTSSSVLSNDGGAAVGGLANTLMSYGLRITDSLAR